jgi:UDPglucose--hexose-1-phosphate uridylyltransferase
MSEIRENRLTGEWVIVAPGRGKRGGNLGRSAERAEIPAFSATCPFCPGNEALTSEERYCVRGSDHQWALRSVANKFSVISATGDVALAACSETAGRLGDCVNAVGLHEVLIETRRHDLDMALLPAVHVQRILEAYRHRFHAFYADSRIRHVVIFKITARKPARHSSIRIRKSWDCRLCPARSSIESSARDGSTRIPAGA